MHGLKLLAALDPFNLLGNPTVPERRLVPVSFRHCACLCVQVGPEEWSHDPAKGAWDMHGVDPH